MEVSKTDFLFIRPITLLFRVPSIHLMYSPWRNLIAADPFNWYILSKENNTTMNLKHLQRVSALIMAKCCAYCNPSDSPYNPNPNHRIVFFFSEHFYSLQRTIKQLIDYIAHKKIKSFST